LARGGSNRRAQSVDPRWRRVWFPSPRRWTPQCVRRDQGPRRATGEIWSRETRGVVAALLSTTCSGSEWADVARAVVAAVTRRSSRRAHAAEHRVAVHHDRRRNGPESHPGAERSGRVFTGRYRLGDVRHLTADCSAAGRVLGWRVDIGLDAGIRSPADHRPVAARNSAGPRPGSATVNASVRRSCGKAN
jgi:hypothetical protein